MDKIFFNLVKGRHSMSWKQSLKKDEPKEDTLYIIIKIESELNRHLKNLKSYFLKVLE